MSDHKTQKLEELGKHLRKVEESIDKNIVETEELRNVKMEDLRQELPEDRMVMLELKAHAGIRLDELRRLRNSPFFMRCDIAYPTGAKKTLYFGTHQFTPENIYSWIAPIATIRFETPGNIQWKLPDGKIMKAAMTRKDQYMVSQGKILFYATEEDGKPRDLIYQEHFSTRKTGFMLPEIVSVMEKAQDQVIRAHHVGPFVISGPAGSGKTTLALHRVAYLTQAPDTAHMYPSKQAIVFVQDTGTKQYFSQLLPELGIHDVTITTFNEWACTCLDIDPSIVVYRFGSTEQERDMYEHEKVAILKKLKEKPPKYSKGYMNLLAEVYLHALSERSLVLWKDQKERGVIDRIDLTMLFVSYMATYKKMVKVEEYLVPGKSGELVGKTRRIPIEYPLIIVDEFQNYLAAQLEIFKKVSGEETQSIIYVGDMAQQVRIGTIREWAEMGEVIDEKRKVTLEKVYRNTVEILEYIGTLGYKVQIPAGLKRGPKVEEITVASQEAKEEQRAEEFFAVQKIVEDRLVRNKETAASVGVLVPDEAYADELRKRFAPKENLFIMTWREAQGVEFDTVILMGITKETFLIDSSYSAELRAEKEKINKDLLYVALTRAMTELVVVGVERLGSVVK